MFTIVNWDTLSDLLLDLLMVLVLCVFLFLWAARVRMRDMQQRNEPRIKPGAVRHRPGEAAPPTDEPAAPNTPRNEPHL